MTLKMSVCVLDELLDELDDWISVMDDSKRAKEIISDAGYALVPVATIKRLDQLYNTDEVAHDKAPEIETCLDELRAAVEA